MIIELRRHILVLLSKLAAVNSSRLEVIKASLSRFDGKANFSRTDSSLRTLVDESVRILVGISSLKSVRPSWLGIPFEVGSRITSLDRNPASKESAHAYDASAVDDILRKIIRCRETSSSGAAAATSLPRRAVPLETTTKTSTPVVRPLLQDPPSPPSTTVDASTAHDPSVLPTTKSEPMDVDLSANGS